MPTRFQHFLAAGVAVLWGLSAAVAAPAPSSDQLQLLLAQYRLPRTLHCLAKTVTDYEIIPPGLFHVEGTQEYWVDGPRFRILQLQESAMYPGMSHDVRWNGELFQWLNVGDGTLVFSRHLGLKTLFVGEPMPLLPLEFFDPAGKNLGVRLSLAQLLSARTLSRLKLARFISSDHTVVEFPGGMMGDTPFDFHIEFKGSLSFLPTVIRRISASGVELDTNEIHYRPVQCSRGVLYLPDQVKMIDRTTDNRTVLISTWTAKYLEADVPIPTETFTVDFQMAKHVLDLDRKQQPGSMVGSRASNGQATRTASSVSVVDGAPGVATIASLAPFLVGLFLLTVGVAILRRSTSSNERMQ